VIDNSEATAASGSSTTRVARWMKRDLLRPYLLMVVALGAGLVWLWIWRNGRSEAIDWPATFHAFTDVLTAAAILVGGGWTVYVLQRRRAHTVRGDISHQCSLWQHGTSRMLRIGVSLKNCGDVTVDPGVSFTLVQLPPQALPKPKDEVELAWSTLARIEHPWQDDSVIIEPGEVETYYYDVALPVEARFVQVTTIVKPAESWVERFHWDETTLVDLEAPFRTPG
jgi:hypothetical protein